MKILFWDVNFNVERRQRPVDEDTVNIMSAFDELSRRVKNLETVTARVERKVYRDEGKDEVVVDEKPPQFERIYNKYLDGVK